MPGWKEGWWGLSSRASSGSLHPFEDTVAPWGGGLALVSWLLRAVACGPDTAQLLLALTYF